MLRKEQAVLHACALPSRYRRQVGALAVLPLLRLVSCMLLLPLVLPLPPLPCLCRRMKLLGGRTGYICWSCH